MRVWQRWLVLVAGLLLVALGCKDPLTAPTALSYSSNPAVYHVGTTIPSNIPMVTGGAASSYSVSPALPTGLVLDPGTGVISGTPTLGSPAATYTVTATNSAGSATCSLSISVLDLAPSGLTYITNPATYTVGLGIVPNTPFNSGGTITAYSVSPALPTGLTLNTSTGVISGTPTAVAAALDYLVTATNSGGNTTVKVNITVNPPALTITAQPGNQSVVVGQTAVFTVTASGQGTLSYQWSRGTSVISGATLSTYVTPATVAGDNGATFSVAVSDTYGTTVTSASATLSVSNVSPGVASPTGGLAGGRAFHTATLLPTGKVLIAGGYDGNSLGTAELYDPATYSFTATGSMATPRDNHTATLLANGKVLIIGGNSYGTSTATAELYDPATGVFTATGSLGTARASHSATMLTASGKVLIVGGRTLPAATYLTSAELYDPTAGTFSPTGALSIEARATHTATLLQTGKVLVAGGFHTTDLASAEIYDPTPGTFAATGSLTVPRSYHTATLLSNGGVLLAGGTASLSTELYNPTPGTFGATGSLATARKAYHAGALLLNGKVLIAAGLGPGSPAPLLSATEVYNPSLGTWSASGSLGVQREAHTATVLADGKVLIVGGIGGAGYLTSAELYQ